MTRPSRQRGQGNRCLIFVRFDGSDGEFLGIFPEKMSRVDVSSRPAWQHDHILRPPAGGFGLLGSGVPSHHGSHTTCF